MIKHDAKQILGISLHRAAYHRHPWTENSTQWSQWPCLIPELQSKQSKVKASVHDWWLTIVSHAFSCSICNLTWFHNFLPYSIMAANNVADIRSWIRLPCNCTGRCWFHMEVRACLSKTNVLFGPYNHAHPQIYQDLQEISPYQATEILTLVVWKESGHAISAIKTPPGGVSSFGNTFLGCGKHCAWHSDPPGSTEVANKNGAKQQVEGWIMLQI